MPLTPKARRAFAAARVLTALRLAPSTARVIRQPMHKRLASAPPTRMLGAVPDVPSRDVRVRTRDGAQVTVRVYEPDGAATPLLYLHGGGFAVGGLASCDHICRRLAVEAQVVVVSVEYRLAPEHPFPGPLHDGEDALDWLLEQGWDTTRLVLGGDSAGGNLAAALSLVARDRGTPLAGQLLVYPALDMTVSSPGARAYRGPGIAPEDLHVCADAYLAGHDPRDPLASPLHAPDLTGLPPALVITVEHDPLREEGRAYAVRLQEAGVPTAAVDVLDHVHASLSLPTLYEGIDELYAVMAAFVRDPLAAATTCK